MMELVAGQSLADYLAVHGREPSFSAQQVRAAAQRAASGEYARLQRRIGRAFGRAEIDSQTKAIVGELAEWTPCWDELPAWLQEWTVELEQRHERRRLGRQAGCGSHLPER